MCGIVAPRREPVPLARAAFVTTYRPFLRALLNPAADPDRFTGYLQRLFRIAQDGGLTSTVSTEVGGVPEVVGETGLLVPPHDPAAFARACQRVLADDVLRHRLAKAGRARALELFPLSRMLGTFGDIYAAVTSGPAVTPYQRLAETGSA